MFWSGRPGAMPVMRLQLWQFIPQAYVMSSLNQTKTEEELQRRLKTDFLGYCDRDDLYADFPSLRHWFITGLARAGVSPKMAQTLARHSNVRLTLGIYTHVELAARSTAIESLPASPTETPAKTEDGSSTESGLSGADYDAAKLGGNPSGPCHRHQNGEPHYLFRAGWATRVCSQLWCSLWCSIGRQGASIGPLLLAGNCTAWHPLALQSGPPARKASVSAPAASDEDVWAWGRNNKSRKRLGLAALAVTSILQ